MNDPELRLKCIELAIGICKMRGESDELDIVESAKTLYSFANPELVIEKEPNQEAAKPRRGRPPKTGPAK